MTEKPEQKRPSKLLPAGDVDRLFTILSRTMPGRIKGAEGPKGQPDAFRTCIACMLSAQSRDPNTDAAAKALFERASDPRTMLQLNENQIAKLIRPCGLYNVKARSIRRFCAALLTEYDGLVPRSRMELMKLPGIGRKCADIVLQFAFGIDTIAVDTHVHRVCNRTGLAIGKTAAQTARHLEERAPAWSLREGHFWLIQLGKEICLSRRPDCPNCPLRDLCCHYRVHGPGGFAGCGELDH